VTDCDFVTPYRLVEVYRYFRRIVLPPSSQSSEMMVNFYWHHIPENTMLQSLLRFNIDGYNLILSRNAEIFIFTSVMSRMVLGLSLLSVDPRGSFYPGLSEQSIGIC
jgi:hypothetical protein